MAAPCFLQLSSSTVVNVNFQRSEFGNFHSSPATHLFNPKHKISPIRCQSTSTDEPKTKRNFLDNASNMLTNLLSGGSLGSMPIAEGAVSDLFGRPLFFSLYDWFIEHGSVYKLAFGPKAFVVVSDAVVARHVLRENAFSYDKVLNDFYYCIVQVILLLLSNVPKSSCSEVGVLADILEPIMGKGLIPADLDTWKQRRRVIAPGFHALYLEAMLDLEAEFSNLALDIVGLGVFNYDFGSVTKESPVIKWIVPRQRKFHYDLKVINDCLDGLIRNAKETREETDVEKLQQRDYLNLKLRDDLMTMLIAGHETTAAVLTWAVFLLAQNPLKMKKAQREIDSVLGWDAPTYESLKKLDQRIKFSFVACSLGCSGSFLLLLQCSLFEILLVGFGESAITLIDSFGIASPFKLSGTFVLLSSSSSIDSVLQFLSVSISQFPGYVIINDSLLQSRSDSKRELELQICSNRTEREGSSFVSSTSFAYQTCSQIRYITRGYNGAKTGYAIPAGTDIFISVYNLHRSPYFWDHPSEFKPERFLVQKPSEGIEGWAGFDPSRSPGALYPNEIISDFAFLPFGGGPRKCVGDQFALMESTVALAMLLQKFDVELRGPPESVELVTGATIHTKSGLWCKLRKRSNVQ
ncbi:hypothetical protein FNV43_RR13180 [Rhamnella rubrinervis]|uniref:Cytochrome P450 n=1 Tax=Rhamnella rubrinervis TaxID=2594499 RepID=A0A8K0MEU1_9ROSA|nr:hypothetical protein FNV43_RR13180 [Rhamnella rubrinervis]